MLKSALNARSEMETKEDMIRYTREKIQEPKELRDETYWHHQ